MTREEAIHLLNNLRSVAEGKEDEAIDMAIEALSSETVHIETYRELYEKYVELKHASAEAVQGWIPLSHDDDGMETDFPYERDGEWVIVTDGNTISVERIKKDAYDHFYPNGRWFELDDVTAWMPLPKPYREESEVKE